MIKEKSQKKLSFSGPHVKLNYDYEYNQHQNRVIGMTSNNIDCMVGEFYVLEERIKPCTLLFTAQYGNRVAFSSVRSSIGDLTNFFGLTETVSQDACSA